MYKVKKHEFRITDSDTWTINGSDYQVNGEEYSNIIRKHYKINRTRDNIIFESHDNPFEDILTHIHDDDFEDND